MRIAIDGRELEGQPTGVGRVIEGLLEAWPEDDRLTLICRRPPASLPAQPNLELSLAPGPRRLPGSLWEQLVLPRRVRRLNSQILLAAGYSMPRFSPCPTVVGMHDCSFLALPETFRFRERLRRRWNARSAARRAELLFMGTEFAAREAQRHLHIAASKTLVLPYGLGAHFRQPEAVDQERVRERYSLPESPVLFVGSGLERRSLSSFVATIEPVLAERPGAGLVIAGRIDDALRDRLPSHVKLLGYVAEGDLPGLYAAATVVAYPSTYEGFGFPVLEALASGTPVVASSAEALCEIYRDRAWLVPHHDQEAWRSAVATLLDDAATDHGGEHRRRWEEQARWARSRTWNDAAVALRRRMLELLGGNR